MLRFGRVLSVRQRRGELDDRDRAAAVVVGAVVDLVALVVRRAVVADVVVVGGDEHVGVLQRRVGPAQQADDVAHLHRPRHRLAQVYRDLRLVRRAQRQRLEQGEHPGVVDGDQRRARTLARGEVLTSSGFPGRSPGRGRGRSRRRLCRLTFTTTAALSAAIRAHERRDHHASQPGLSTPTPESRQDTALPSTCSAVSACRLLASPASILKTGRPSRRKPRKPLQAHSLLADADRCDSPILHLERKAVGVGLEELPVGGLEIAVVADRFEPGAAELGGDVLGGEVEPARRRVATFEQVRGEERQVTVQRVGRDPVEGGGLVLRKRHRLARRRIGERVERYCNDRQNGRDDEAESMCRENMSEKILRTV